jgi:thioredoxin reductase (NADPH)
VLAKLALRDQPVALIVADQRMPQMPGPEMLRQARTHGPGAKYLLLTAYADTDVAINAINDIGLDYYLLKPWDPPEERLYPVVDDLLGDWRQANPDQTSDVRVIGHGGPTAATTSRCSWPATTGPTGGLTSSATPRPAGCTTSPLRRRPICRWCSCPTATRCARRRCFKLAGALGLHTSARQPLYDVCIVGGGPAGLPAAVYAASEGLTTFYYGGYRPVRAAG